MSSHVHRHRAYSDSLNLMNRRDFLKLSCISPISAHLAAWRTVATAGSTTTHTGAIFDATLSTSVVPTVGADSKISFNRPSAAFVLDCYNIYQKARPREVRFLGARRVENLLPHSEDFTLFSGMPGFAIAKAEPDPSGGGRASTITALKDNATLAFSLPATAGHVYVTGIFVRRRKGHRAISIVAPSGNQWLEIRPTSVWQRFSSGPAASTGSCAIGIQLQSVGDSLDIAFAQIEDVTSRSQDDRAISEYVSVGVLRFPFHGCCVDGVQYFSYESANRLNTKTRAVTETQGMAIPERSLKGALLEGLRNNLCTNYNLNPTDLTGVSVSGGKLELMDDSSVLFADANLNPRSGAVPYPTLRGISNGKAFLFENTTRHTQTVTISGRATAGRHSAFIYARTTHPATQFALGPRSAVELQTASYYTNLGEVYRRFQLENVQALDGEQLQLIVPPRAVVRFIGNQLESGTFCSSLIETRGVPAVREGDVLSYTPSVSRDQTSGSLHLAWNAPYASSNAPSTTHRCLLSIANKDRSNSQLYLDSSDHTVSGAGIGPTLVSSAKFLKDANLALGLTWDLKRGSHLYQNGKVTGSAPYTSSLAHPGSMGIGHLNASAFPFGSYKDLRIYDNDIGDSGMIGQLMTVNSARVLFTGNHLDFYESPFACEAFVGKLRRAGFNVIFPYVWGGNGTRYVNDLGVPIDYRVAKHYRRGFDGLAYLIALCHEANIEVHPVFTVITHGWSKQMAAYEMYFDDPRPPQTGNSEFYNVHMPDFRTWISQIMVEFVSNHDVDGLCFDVLRAGIGYYASKFNVADYRQRYGRDLRSDIRAGINAPGVKLREWNRKDIEAILDMTVTAVRSTKPDVIISNAGLGQCTPIGGHQAFADQGQYNVDWVNSGKIDYIIPWDYAHPIEKTDWSYKHRLNDRRKGTVMGGLYHGKNPIEPLLLHSIMPSILADDGDMAALYPYWTMSQEHIDILRSQYFNLPARIPWRN